MKKMVMFVLLAVAFMGYSCATTVVRDGSAVTARTWDPNVARTVADPNSDYSTPLERACSVQVALGHASYYQMDGNVYCMVNNENGAEAMGQFEVDGHGININPRRHIGVEIVYGSFVREPYFMVGPGEIYPIKMLPGPYTAVITYLAEYTVRGEKRYRPVGESTTIYFTIEPSPFDQEIVHNGQRIKTGFIIKLGTNSSRR